METLIIIISNRGVIVILDRNQSTVLFIGAIYEGVSESGSYRTDDRIMNVCHDTAATELGKGIHEGSTSGVQEYVRHHRPET
jgi:hypothetical protein